MLVVELKSGASIPLPGGRYLRRDGESLIVESETGDVVRVFARADVNALRIGPDDKPGTRRSIEPAA